MLDQEERRLILVAIDKQWQEHLYEMDSLREGVSLRAQGQKDPLVEYKNEAYTLFVTLMDAIKQEALQNLFRSAANLEAILKQLHSAAIYADQGDAISSDDSADEAPRLKLNLPKRKPSFVIENVGRNAQCPCGSGNKFKQCCGKNA
jgi:preprotein translocase subunit SecA